MSQPRELLCQRCDSDYPVWFAPNDLWNRVVRDGLTRGGEQVEVERGEQYLCPTCFAVLALERDAVSPYAVFRLEENK